MTKSSEKVRLTTPVGTISYPNFFKARAVESDDGKKSEKFSCLIIWEPSKFSPADKKRWADLLAALDSEAKAVFKKGWEALSPVAFKKGIRKNSDRAEPFEGFSADAVFANLSSDYQPGVIDVNGNEVSKGEGNMDIVYPGCKGRIKVNIYSFTNPKNKGLGLGLNNVQIIVSDETKAPRLDNKKSAADDFAGDGIDEEWLEDSPEEDDDL